MPGKQATQAVIISILVLICLSTTLQAWTRSELRGFLRQGIGQQDSTQGDWSNTELNSQLNRAVYYVSTQSQIGVPTDSLIPIQKGVTEYGLPSTFLFEKNVKLRIGDRDSLRTLNWSDQLVFGFRYLGEDGNSVIRPVEYTIYADSVIEVCPIPKLSADTIQVKYMAVQTLDADTTTCNLPVFLQEAIVYYGVSLCKMYDFDQSGQQMYLALADKVIADYKEKIGNKPTMPSQKPILEEK